jgi:hypothetical protein
MENRIVGLDQSQRAFPSYYGWYMQNRNEALPYGWYRRNMEQLDNELIAYDSTFATYPVEELRPHWRRKVKWYAERFMKIRSLLGDHTIRPTSRSAPLGQPTYIDSERSAATIQKKMEDAYYAMARIIVKAEASDRTKQEKAEQYAGWVAKAFVNVTDEIITRYNNTDDLVNYLLREQTYDELPTNEDKSFAAKLPFGARTIHEAIQIGAREHPNFHFNLCTTTREDTEGEWYNYLTGISRNGIFHYADQPAGTTLEMIDVLVSGEYDLKFIPFLRYRGTQENGYDRLLLDVESKSQNFYHKQLPIGTVGFRYDKAGRPHKAEEIRVCTCYFVFSERKFLQKVEEGTLSIGPTKRNEGCGHLYNHTLWDREKWVPVAIP